MKIIVSQEIASVCPEFVGAAVEAWVKNSAYSQELWDEIHLLEEKFRASLTTDSLKDMPSIAARILRAIVLPVSNSFAGCCRVRNCIR